MEGIVNIKLGSALVASAMLLSSGSSYAYEFGTAPWRQYPGLVLGDAATAPPPGLYMFNQVATYQAQLIGPGAPNINGSKTSASVDGAATGILWVPGWNFLGGAYDAVVVQPALSTSIASPIDASFAGLANTYIVPVELSWKLGNSGFFVKTGLGIDVPDGTITGPMGTGNQGSAWWTFQPEFVVSYLRDGWNLTANIFGEINTKNYISGYTSGDLLHAEFTATKTVGKWTVGPVGYYVGQVTKDQASSASYGGAVNTGRYDIWAAGGLVAYDFGSTTLKVWAVDQVLSTASGGTAGPPGIDTASIPKGWGVYSSLSYRLWAPDNSEMSSSKKLIYKD